MKKILFALVAISMFAFASCSKEDEKNSKEEIVQSNSGGDFSGYIFSDSTSTVKFEPMGKGTAEITMIDGSTSTKESITFAYHTLEAPGKYTVHFIIRNPALFNNTIKSMSGTYNIYDRLDLTVTTTQNKSFNYTLYKK